MSTPQIAYRIYINSPQERVWEALHKPEDTSRYWGPQLFSDWKVGSHITWITPTGKMDDPESIIIDFDSPNRLTYKWHFVEAENRSTISFQLEPYEDMVKLTLTHDGFKDGSHHIPRLNDSTWPRVMSQLKTYLESEAGKKASA